MGSITGNFQTSLLMRVGSRESIENCYKTKTLQFGCAANWLDYALTCKNKSTGDIFECVFARVFKNDPRITSMKDSRGNPMGDHLLVLENESENISILRYVPTILLPVMCFYSFNVKKIIHKVDLANHPFKWFAFNLDEYCKIMDYNNDEASFLFITDPVRFFEELKTQNTNPHSH